MAEEAWGTSWGKRMRMKWLMGVARISMMAVLNAFQPLFALNPNGKSISPISHNVDPISSICSISIPDGIVDKNLTNMDSILVGKYVGLQPNIEFIRSWVAHKWRGNGQTEVTAMPNIFFSFSFTCDEDLKLVLAGGPWLLGKSSLALKKWEPRFNPKDWKCNEAPIWVCLLGLPLEYWDEKIFY
ncbi:uncharacterized protein LOC131876510 [Cryptomeria japonica]|uniref:uncharacterized protein LOC131876510 n=1 Tax=Cryptomeria japonica TaxID=3369 RepID=UPI0027DA4DCD|nr:uncharacterized protein LOC131876510 [Cryptomeria japonica]